MKVLIQRTHTRNKKMVFSTPEASISRMTKMFGVRKDQISSSKPPMLDYTCGAHTRSRGSEYFQSYDMWKCSPWSKLSGKKKSDTNFHISKLFRWKHHLSKKQVIFDPKFISIKLFHIHWYGSNDFKTILTSESRSEGASLFCTKIKVTESDEKSYNSLFHNWVFEFDNVNFWREMTIKLKILSLNFH